MFSSSAVGVGKTCIAGGFVRGVMKAQGFNETISVPSPSFNLLISYGSDRGIRVHHIDAYRLTSASDAAALGVPALFASDVVIVEWPERIRGLWPTTALHVTIETSPDVSADGSGGANVDASVAAVAQPWIDEDALVMPRRVTLEVVGQRLAESAYSGILEALAAARQPTLF